MRDYKKEFIDHIKEVYSHSESESMWRIFDEDDPMFPSFKDGSISRLEWEYYFEKVLNRLLCFEPIQYIVEKAYFYDRFFVVNRHVLIPRPETEELIHLIIQTHKKPNLDVLDIGTGTGCIPILLQDQLNQSTCTGWDVSLDALDVAERNAKESNLNILFEKVDILTHLKDARNWDIIVSNPPYIPPSELDVMSESTKRYEPDLALYVPEEDPLLFYRVITDFAYAHLKSGGHLYFECNEFNAQEVKEMIKSKFNEVKIIKDFQSKDRMISAVK